jgi:SAM-dependent methyltransferase
MNFLIRNKEKLKSLKYSEYILSQRIYEILRIGNIILKFFTISSYRNQTISRVRYKKNFHQISHFTQENRYPDLFEIFCDYFKYQKPPYILSFGCSTGEEVYSLGKYIPNVKIVGTDISKWCVKECIKKYKDSRFIFLHSKSTILEQMKDFDAIFCLAVFQHTHNRTEFVNTAIKYCFSQFEQQVIILDQKLKIGGLLFVDNCDFNFQETSVSKNYSPLKYETNKILRNRPLFNKYNTKISEVTDIYRIFIKDY